MYDAIVIFGGGVTEDGQPTPWAKVRLDTAIQLKNECKIYIVSTRYTCLKPPYISALTGKPLEESAVYAKYLKEVGGIPYSHIYIENTSMDTIGNAYFTKILFTDILHLYNLLIITSDFHLRRVQLICDWIFGLSYTNKYKLTYLGTDDSSLHSCILELRKQKERERIIALKQLIPTITTLEEFHSWLYSKHSAYTSVSVADPFELTDYIKHSKILQTY